MATNRIDILLSADDRATRQIKRFEDQTKTSSNNIKKSFSEIAIKAAAIVVAIEGVRRTLSTFVDAASKVQQLETRLTVLTGSMQKGNELFRDMANLASRVPFEFDQIMESAVNLRAVVKGGNEEVNKLMPIILDLAATTGLGVQETTSQMIRMYSAGAGAADLFRERGVLAMLGFQAGVSVSAEETIDRVIAAWEDADSRFRGATDSLAETWKGRVSVMQDAWFNFRSEVGKGFLDSNLPQVLTTALDFWTERIRESRDSVEEYSEQLNFMHGRLEEINEAIEKNLEKQSAPFLLNRNEIEEQFNNLLIQRSRILQTINEFQAQETIELEPIEVKRNQIEEEIQLEMNKINLIESFHNNLSNKITAFRNKEFKDEKEKNKARKQLQQEILNTQVSNLETFLQKQAEGNKAAAVAFKAIQITRAIINTHEAVTEALPNLPLAAAVAAMGAVEVAAIAATPLEEGGIVKARPGGTLALIGEGGRDEAVIPLDNSSGQFGDVNIFIQGGINPGGSSVEEMAEELGFAFEKEVRTARGF